jgi:hypothetical protein
MIEAALTRDNHDESNAYLATLALPASHLSEAMLFIKATQLLTYSLAPLFNWVLDSACLPLFPSNSLIHPFSNLAHFRAFWTLSLPSRLDVSTQLTTSPNLRHDSHRNASMHGHCSHFSFPVHCQVYPRRPYSSTTGA